MAIFLIIFLSVIVFGLVMTIRILFETKDDEKFAMFLMNDKNTDADKIEGKEENLQKPITKTDFMEKFIEFLNSFFAFLGKLFESKKSPPKIEDHWANHICKKEKILSDRELTMYKILSEWANKNGKFIFANTNLYCVLKNTDQSFLGKLAWNKIKSKQIDFTCVSSSGKIEWCMELDDSTHDTASGQKRDNDKDLAFQGAGIYFFRTRTHNKLPEFITNSYK